jgi:hypothetical protein
LRWVGRFASCRVKKAGGDFPRRSLQPLPLALREGRHDANACSADRRELERDDPRQHVGEKVFSDPFPTLLLRIASLPLSTGNVNVIIMRMVPLFVPSYDFGAVRVATFALLTFTALSGSPSCGIVIAKFSGQAVIFRSSPTLFGTDWMPGSTSTRILSGKPPRATWSAAMLFGL